MNVRWNIKLSILLIALFIGNSSSWAQASSYHTKSSFGKGDPTCKGQGCLRVPEIDAAGTMPALALLGGVIALVMERKRRK